LSCAFSYSQIGRLGSVSFNSGGSAPKKKKSKAPSQKDIICFILEGFLAQCSSFMVRNGKGRQIAGQLLG